MGNDKSKPINKSVSLQSSNRSSKSQLPKYEPSPLKLNPPNNILIQNSEMFLFGCDGQNHPKIVAFDPTTESFINIQVPPNFNILNYSQAVTISKDLIALTGGTNKDKSIISYEAFLYNKTTNSVKVLPYMSQGRFSHISIYHNNRLYVFGGRSNPGDQNILSHCEFLSLIDEKTFELQWTKIANSILRRCTGFALVYQDEIYLIGGYTGQRKRSKKIEKYSSMTNSWAIINLRLLYGCERGLLLNGNNPNEFMVFGGKIRSGDSNMVYIYNLKSQTYSYGKEMLNERVLQKGFESQITNFIYMIGGDTQNSVEKVKRAQNNLGWEWLKVPSNSPLKEQIKQFAHSQYSVIVPSGPEISNFNENFSNEEKKNVLFGTDCEPFILIIDVNRSEMTFKPVPNPLRLYGYQGVTKLQKNGSYFICGGLFYSRKKISRDAYIFDAATHSVVKCQKMIGMRYTMNIIAKDDKVYVIGGRSYGGDNEGILNTCEYYDLNKNVWNVIAPLNKKRCTAMSFLINNVIYIAGGYNGNVLRETSFETYNESNDVWNFLGVELNEPLEASLVLNFENKILFLGGRNKSGDSQSCMVYDYSFGIDTMHLESTCKLTNKKCLHKSIGFEKHILLLGGEKFEQDKFVEFVGITKNGAIIIGPFVPSNLKEFAGKVNERLGKTLKDPKMQKYGFA